MASSPRMAAPFDQVAVIGFAWYLKQDYPAILGIMADAHTLPATHEKWLYLAHKRERDLRSSGKIVVRAIIDPAAFPEWCRSRNLNIDASGRMAFANDYAYRHGRN